MSRLLAAITSLPSLLCLLLYHVSKLPSLLRLSRLLRLLEPSITSASSITSSITSASSITFASITFYIYIYLLHTLPKVNINGIHGYKVPPLAPDLLSFFHIHTQHTAPYSGNWLRQSTRKGRQSCGFLALLEFGRVSVLGGRGPRRLGTEG